MPHVAVYMYECAANQGIPVSPESDRVDCLDARNSPHLKVTSKLPFPGSLRLSLSLSFSVSFSSLQLALPSSRRVHLRSPLPASLSFYVSTLDSKERAFLDRKISDRRNCSDSARSYHAVSERSAIRYRANIFDYLRECGIPPCRCPSNVNTIITNDVSMIVTRHKPRLAEQGLKLKL